MTLLYADERFLLHDTGRHPERAERLVQIYRHLARTGLDVRCPRPAWEPASLERLARIHDPAYIEQIRAFATRGGGRIEEDTTLSPASADVAMLAAGAVCDGVTRVLQGEDKQALCLVRPPGHHALPAAAMGFCLFNNVAVAARVAIDEFQLDRVLIVDFDVHHGNGTQDEFWEDPRVGFLSIHRWPFYPGTGDAHETGSGPGLGTTLNLPVEMGTEPAEYQKLFADRMSQFADRFQPQLILLSAGFDAHRDDPVGSLGLETEDFQSLTQSVLNVANAHCEGRLVSVLEGGYNTGVLAGCVALHLETLLAAEAQ